MALVHAFAALPTGDNLLLCLPPTAYLLSVGGFAVSNAISSFLLQAKLSPATKQTPAGIPFSSNLWLPPCYPARRQGATWIRRRNIWVLLFAAACLPALLVMVQWLYSTASDMCSITRRE